MKHPKLRGVPFSKQYVPFLIPSPSPTSSLSFQLNVFTYSKIHKAKFCDILTPFQGLLTFTGTLCIGPRVELWFLITV